MLKILLVGKGEAHLTYKYSQEFLVSITNLKSETIVSSDLIATDEERIVVQLKLLCICLTHILLQLPFPLLL